MSTTNKPKKTEKPATKQERAVNAIMSQDPPVIEPVLPSVKLHVPYHAAVEETNRLYGLSAGNLAGTQGAILTELVWARLERRANDG